MAQPRTLPRTLSAAARGREVSRVAARYRRRLAAGADGRHWYREAWAWAVSAVGCEAAPMLLRLIAATSPRASIKGNLRAALRAYRLIRAGRDTAEGGPYGVPANAKNVRRVAEGRPLTGQKVRPFGEALLGDGRAVAVDVWVSRAAGYRDAPTAREVGIVTAACCRVARSVGWTAAEVQAAVWTAERRAAGWTASETYREAWAAIMVEGLET